MTTFGKKLLSKSASQTLKIGRALSAELTEGDIVCLFGALGSGKTILAKGIASGLGIAAAEVVSPTFVLIRRLQGKFPFYHLDLYRLERAEDILGLGYEEYLYADGVSVVEWAERLGTLLPRNYIKVRLEFAGRNRRWITIQRALGRQRLSG